MGTVVTGTVPFLDAGQQNTAAILEGCPEPDIAARLADSWIDRQKNDPLKQLQNEKETVGDEQGKKYDDWYLPSFVETFLFLDAIGRLRPNDASLYPLFPDGDYWTSTHGDNNFMNTIGDGATTAFLLTFTTIPAGEPSFITYRLDVEFAPKDLVAQVRAIRAF